MKQGDVEGVTRTNRSTQSDQKLVQCAWSLRKGKRDQAFVRYTRSTWWYDKSRESGQVRALRLGLLKRTDLQQDTERGSWPFHSQIYHWASSPMDRSQSHPPPHSTLVGVGSWNLDRYEVSKTIERRQRWKLVRDLSIGMRTRSPLVVGCTNEV